MRCCDLAIGLADGIPPLLSSVQYGLLWADPESVEGDIETVGGWQGEDVSHLKPVYPLPCPTSVLSALVVPSHKLSPPNMCLDIAMGGER